MFSVNLTFNFYCQAFFKMFSKWNRLILLNYLKNSPNKQKSAIIKLEEEKWSKMKQLLQMKKN